MGGGCFGRPAVRVMLQLMLLIAAAALLPRALALTDPADGTRPPALLSSPAGWLRVHLLIASLSTHELHCLFWGVLFMFI